jgi:two-component system chemotaxis response regulator CheB
MVAEDSPTVRELLIEILQHDPEIRVVGQARNGAEAVELAGQLRPDLITMDIHMPIMDGLEATKEIMARAPTPILIVSSSVSGREVELSMNAIRAGALMVVQKPDNPQSLKFNGRREELLAMAKAMAQVKVVRRWAAAQARQAPPAPSRHPTRSQPVRLVAIAASTGGPAALQRLLSGLPMGSTPPILAVQHIATGFVGGLADWLSESCRVRVKVADHGEALQKRTVYLAPDGKHLGVGPGERASVVEGPPIKGFRPSGTHLFESAARAMGPRLAAVILTGMGDDGVEGLRAVRAAGGYVLAQDEGSSVVYGMPREAAAAGVVDAVLPLDDLASHLAELFGRGG